jgi:hypothetical protein
MRLFLAAFALSSILTGSSVFAQSDEPLTGGSPAPKSARFETSPAQQYLVSKARAESLNRESFLRYNDWSGYDYAHPQVNAGVFTNAQPPFRMRRFYTYPGLWYESRGYGF